MHEPEWSHAVGEESACRKGSGCMQGPEGVHAGIGAGACGVGNKCLLESERVPAGGCKIHAREEKTKIENFLKT